MSMAKVTPRNAAPLVWDRSQTGVSLMLPLCLCQVGTVVAVCRLFCPVPAASQCWKGEPLFCCCHALLSLVPLRASVHSWSTAGVALGLPLSLELLGTVAVEGEMQLHHHTILVPPLSIIIPAIYSLQSSHHLFPQPVVRQYKSTYCGGCPGRSTVCLLWTLI